MTRSCRQVHRRAPALAPALTPPPWQAVHLSHVFEDARGVMTEEEVVHDAQLAAEEAAAGDPDASYDLGELMLFGARLSA